jgi:hypothetical protein
MKRLALALALLAPLTQPADAQPQNSRNGYIAPLGYCQLTSVSSATAVSSCSGGIPQRAAWAVICIETAAIRYRDDGTDPTTSVGMPLAAGQCMGYRSKLSALKVIAQTGSPVVNIAFYDGVAP